MTDTNGQTGPGWFQDPHGAPVLRWWDGVQWTAHVSAPAYAPTPERRPVGPETPLGTVWVWLVAMLPLLSSANVFLIHPSLPVSFTGDGSVITGHDPFSLFGGPMYFVAVGFGWLLTAAIIVFGWLDYRQLAHRGVDRPFHWAWGFLGPIVYVVGRTVILRRVAPGRGMAPLWATIAAQVVSSVTITVWIVVIMAGMMSDMTTQISQLPVS